MKIVAALSLIASGNLMTAKAFVAKPPASQLLLQRNQRPSASSLHMVLEKSPAAEKKLAKIEVLKIESDHLRHPLKEVGLYGCHACFLPDSHITWKNENRMKPRRSDDYYSFPV
jgi:hypothetical protein